MIKWRREGNLTSCWVELAEEDDEKEEEEEEKDGEGLEEDVVSLSRPSSRPRYSRALSPDSTQVTANTQIPKKKINPITE